MPYIDGFVIAVPTPFVKNHAPDISYVLAAGESVAPVLKECAEAGVPAAIAWAGGFAEAGVEDPLVARCREEAACR